MEASPLLALCELRRQDGKPNESRMSFEAAERGPYPLDRADAFKVAARRPNATQASRQSNRGRPRVYFLCDATVRLFGRHRGFIAAASQELDALEPEMPHFYGVEIRTYAALV